MSRRSWLLVALLMLFELFLARYAPRALGYVDLPLALVVYCGWRGHAAQGAIAGTILGLLQDLLWKLPLGINGLAKTLVGYLSALAGRYFMSEGPLVQTILLTLMGLANTLVFFVLSSALDLALGLGYWRSSVIQIGLTTVVGLFVFALLRRMQRERPGRLRYRRF